MMLVDRLPVHAYNICDKFIAFVEVDKESIDNYYNVVLITDISYKPLDIQEDLDLILIRETLDGQMEELTGDVFLDILEFLSFQNVLPYQSKYEHPSRSIRIS